MLVSTSNGIATVVTPSGEMHSIPFEPLSERDMFLQARYHLWQRANDYRREFVCGRCREAMETDTQANEDTQTWELLTVCSCRALYGMIALKDLHSLIGTFNS